MARARSLVLVDFRKHPLLKYMRDVRLDMKIHVSLAAGRALLYGLVVDEEKHQEVASVHLPENFDVHDCCLSLKARGLYVLYYAASAQQVKKDYTYTQELLATLDADQIFIHKHVAGWKDPQAVASSPSPTASSQEIKMPLAAKAEPPSSSLATSPKVSAMVRTLARAIPSSSRLAPPSSQASRGAQPPHQPPHQSTTSVSQSTRGASPPHPPPLQVAPLPPQAPKSTHHPLPVTQQPVSMPSQATPQQRGSAPRLTRALGPPAVAPPATAVAIATSSRLSIQTLRGAQPSHPPPQQQARPSSMQTSRGARPNPHHVAVPPIRPSRGPHTPHPLPQQVAPVPSQIPRGANPPPQVPQQPVSVPVPAGTQQRGPPPRLAQALDPPAVASPATAVPAATLSTTKAESPKAMSPTPMVTIGKLTADRLHDVDQDSIQVPSDMTPSAHFVVDALGKRGIKSHNHVLSHWGHVSAGEEGIKVAWNAFALFDGFGRKGPALHAAKDLVDNILAAVNQAAHDVVVADNNSCEEVAYALQVTFAKTLPQAMAAGFEASNKQMRTRGSDEQEGSMATLALMCGHQLTVATAGTSQAYLDTGSHLLLMSSSLCAEDGKPSAGIPTPTIKQVALPVQGARLLMGSKAFWQSIPFKQSVKGVRCKSAREAPTALQMVAINDGVQLHPTIFVADLLPVGCATNQLDFQLLKKQEGKVEVWCPLEPATPTNTHPDWPAILAMRRHANPLTLTTCLPTETTAGKQAEASQAERLPAAANRADKPGAETPMSHTPEDHIFHRQTTGGNIKLTKAAKKRAGKRRAQARKAETGELVLKQQEQLAALARQQRKHLASSPSLPAPQHALDDMPVDKMADKHNDIATEDTANKPAEEPVVTSEGPRGQRQGRGRSTTGRWRNNSGGRGQALHQGQGTVAAMHYPARHQTQTGSKQVSPQALRQAQLATARVLNRPFPHLTPSPLRRQGSSMNRPDRQTGLAAATQPQGSTDSAQGPTTMAKASRAGQQHQSGRTDTYQQQQHQAVNTQAVAVRQADTAVNINMQTQPSSRGGVTPSTGKRQGAPYIADDTKCTRVDGYPNLCEIRRPRRV